MRAKRTTARRDVYGIRTEVGHWFPGPFCLCDLGKSQDSVSLSISVGETGMTVPASQVAGKFLWGDAWKVPTAVPGAQGELW